VAALKAAGQGAGDKWNATLFGEIGEVDLGRNTG